MLAIKTNLHQAQKLKKFMIKNNLFNRDYNPKKEMGFIYFPLVKLLISKKFKGLENSKNFQSKLMSKLKFKDVKITDIKLTKIEKQLNLNELLKDKLTSKQFKSIPRSQEIIGSILVLEIPDKLKKKEKIIAQAFLKAGKNIKTVVKKFHTHKGTYRLRKVKILAGEKTKETVHKENGIKLKIDLEKTYFSARLANERLRIAKQIKKPEEVLVMFSGAAPYPLVLARISPVKLITGIEINPLAHQLALESINLNRLAHKIHVFEGDVRDILPKIKKRFDRIIMPLPKTGELFLPLALTKVKRGTIMHFYAFIEENKIDQETKKIKDICCKNKHKIRIIKKVICGQFSPHIVRVCLDIKLIK
jgi:tRNA (guanine37-N1)-methyltransferase